MRETIALFAYGATFVLCAVSQGCQAIPDEDSVDDLRDTVAAFPDGVKITMSKWAANRIAYGYLLAKRRDSPIGYIDCPGLGRHPYFVSDMLKCLAAHQTDSYKSCFSWMMQDFYNDTEYVIGDPCYWTHLPEFAPDNMPEEFDADRVTLDHLTEALIGPPPPKEIQLMLLQLGMLGRGGILCTQGVDWACPEDPFALDDQTSSSSASGGGDR